MLQPPAALFVEVLEGSTIMAIQIFRPGELPEGKPDSTQSREPTSEDYRVKIKQMIQAKLPALTRKLSRLQKAMLSRLFQARRKITVRELFYRARIGSGKRLYVAPKNKRAYSASLSRALARLQKRGLICKHKQAVHLSEYGTEVVKKLARNG
jgi:hypothetical protein